MGTSELLAYLTLYFSPGVGARRLISLRQHFGTAEAALAASDHALSRVPGLGRSTVAAMRQRLPEAAKEANRQVALVPDDVTLLTYFDEAYPASLREIYDPPALLFATGTVELLARDRKIAIIGTRRATDYGKRIAKELTEALITERVVIVSGFALGIDTVAHQAAYRSEGDTIAVLGSGVDVIYPSSNKAFAKELRSSGRGLILSELPMGSTPDARNFLWRNRIVSGLSAASIIVESDEKGGSMITASLALDQNREVLAVPGDLGRTMSAGPNYLIRESRAKLVRNAEDVLTELGWSSAAAAKKQKSPLPPLSLFEQRIVDALESAGTPLHIDALAERVAVEVQDLLVQLLALEFKNVVRQMAGKHFLLVS